MSIVSLNMGCFKRIPFLQGAPKTVKPSDQTAVSDIAVSRLSAKSDESLQTEQPKLLSEKEVKVNNATEGAKSSKKESRKQVIKRAFWSAMGIWGTYNFIDAGLARTLALETLTHGTGPLGYIGISRNGADPNYGGGKTGSSVGGGENFHIENSKNYFHVFKDTEFKYQHKHNFLEELAGEEVFPYILPRMHAVLSGAANFGYSKVKETGNIVSGFAGAAVGSLTPTLKFRFTPEEVVGCENSCRFENDPDYETVAYRTSRYISPMNLGVTGSLTQGVNSGMFQRMYDRPGKVALGVALLGLGALVAKRTYAYIKSPIKQEEAPSKPVEETSLSRSQLCKKRFKVIAASACWTTLAVSAVFLNTL